MLVCWYCDGTYEGVHGQPCPMNHSHDFDDSEHIKSERAKSREQFEREYKASYDRDARAVLAHMNRQRAAVGLAPIRYIG